MQCESFGLESVKLAGNRVSYVHRGAVLLRWGVDSVEASSEKVDMGQRWGGGGKGGGVLQLSLEIRYPISASISRVQKNITFWRGNTISAPISKYANFTSTITGNCLYLPQRNQSQLLPSTQFRHAPVPNTIFRTIILSVLYLSPCNLTSCSALALSFIGLSLQPLSQWPPFHPVVSSLTMSMMA